LAKSSNDDYDTEWTSLPEETMPTGGTAGQILSKIDGNDFNTEWITPAPTGNAIINGAFEINQRSFSSSTTNLTFGFDRWRQSHTGGTTTVSAQSFTPGAAPLAGLEGKSFVRIITTGQTDAGHFTLYGQKIESVRTFAGQTVTLSFYARAGSGTPSISNELVQNFGNGGSPSAAVLGISPNKFELSTSWQRFTAIIQVPSITGKTIGTTDDGFLELNFFVSGGSNFNARTVSLGVQNSTFEIWGVQLEAGSVATPFRRNAPSIQAELATCQRYYTRLIDPPGSGVGTGGTGGGASRVSVSLPVEMRVLPSISGTGTFSFWNGGAARSGTFNAVNVFSSKTAVEVEFDLDGAFTQGNAVKMYTQNSTSRFLELSAEL
jgi:hypothetical protein